MAFMGAGTNGIDKALASLRQGMPGPDPGARLVRLLPVFALLLPALILCAGAWITWRATWREARAELVRTADAGAEYGARVLTGYAVAAARINESLRGLTDAEIVARERDLHVTLSRLVTEVPQAEASYVIDREGRPLLSANIYPVPKDRPLSADRDFFLALSGPHPPETHVSRVYVGRFDNKPFFAVSRARRGSGNPPGPAGFDGVVNISVDPSQLATAMRRLLGDAPGVLALIRDDGAILARTHGPNGPLPDIRPASRFHALAAARLPEAVFYAPNTVDGTEQLIAVRRMEGFPIYAAANRPRTAIVASWRDTVASHLIFGLPATLALFALSLNVRRNQNRMERSNAALEGRVRERTAELAELSDALDLSATLIIEEDGTIRHWSLGCQRLYGFTREEAEGRLARELLHTEYPSGGRVAAVLATRASGQWLGELQQRHKDGTPRIILSSWVRHAGVRQAAPRLVVKQTDITALRRAEAALVESEDRLRRAQDAAGVHAFEVDGAGHIRCSDEFLALYGVAPGTPFDFQSLLAAVEPEDRAALLASLRAPEGGGAFHAEYRTRGADGALRWLLALGEAMPGPGEAPSRLVGVNLDITARKAAEAALAESEARLRLSQEAAGIGTWELFYATGQQVWSTRTYDLMGLDPAEGPPGLQRAMRCIHPDDAGRVAEALAEGEASGFYSQEFRVLRVQPGGAPRVAWLASLARRFEGANAASRRLLGVVYDITERKAAEAALADSAERLLMAQSAAKLGIWDQDLVTGRRTWDTRMLELYGLPPGTEVTSDLSDERVHPDDRAARASAIAKSRDPAGDGMLEVEFRVAATPGAPERWLAVNGRCTFHEGRPVRAVGTARDVTERRRTEERNTLLMREVDHRAKNALQVVQAALRLTEAPSQAAFIRAVEGRVAALARAQSMLAQRRWDGAELRALLEGELAPFRAPGGSGPQTTLDGPKVTVNAKAAQPLCMTLHELATNAVKYGALSAAEGHVSVRWQLLGGQLRLVWKETGGPALMAAPGRRGFGSRVIEQTVRGQLGGSVEMEWQPGGLVCTMTLPLDRENTASGPGLAAE